MAQSSAQASRASWVRLFSASAFFWISTRRMRKWVSGRPEARDQPSLRALRRSGKAEPERVEAAVEALFPEAGRARKRRLMLYAQRLYSRLRTAEIARRYGRSHAAVSIALKDLDAAAWDNAALAEGLARLQLQIT